MFIRAKKSKGRTYYQVVRNVREGGKVRQVVMVSLGSSPTFDGARRDARAAIAFYRRALESAANKQTTFAARCSAGIAKQEEYLARLDEVEAAMSKPGAGATTVDDVVPPEPSKGERAVSLDDWCASFLYRHDQKWGWGMWLVTEWAEGGIGYFELGCDLADVLSKWDSDKIDPRLDADRRKSKARTLPAGASTALLSGGSWTDEDNGEWHGFDAVVRAEVDRLLRVFAEEDEREREWEEHKRARAEARKVAPWPDPEKYVYWRKGEGRSARWTAHRIIGEDRSSVTFSPYGCRLHDIGTDRDPHLRLKGFEAFGLLHSIMPDVFNGDYSHDLGRDGTLFLNCDAVRAAYGSERPEAKTEGEFWEEFWGQAEDAGLGDAFRRFFGEDSPQGKGRPRKEDLDTLGIDWPCDAPTLKAAYRRRSMQAHPDRGGTTDEMARVNAAHDRILKFVA